MSLIKKLLETPSNLPLRRYTQRSTMKSWTLTSSVLPFGPEFSRVVTSNTISATASATSRPSYVRDHQSHRLLFHTVAECAENLWHQLPWATPSEYRNQPGHRFKMRIADGVRGGWLHAVDADTGA